MSKKETSLSDRFESGMTAIEPALVSQQRPHHTSNLNNVGDGKKDEILEMSHTILSRLLARCQFVRGRRGSESSGESRRFDRWS